MPDFQKNILRCCILILNQVIGLCVGERLIKTLKRYLKEQRVSAVHFGTFSEAAKDFFIKMGFTILFSR